MKKFYEDLRRTKYSRDEAKEILELLSPLHKKLNEKPRGAKEPVTQIVNSLTGKKMQVTIFTQTGRVE